MVAVGVFISSSSHLFSADPVSCDEHLATMRSRGLLKRTASGQSHNDRVGVEERSLGCMFAEDEALHGKFKGENMQFEDNIH